MKSLYRAYPALVVCVSLIWFAAGSASLARAQDACKVALMRATSSPPRRIRLLHPNGGGRSSQTTEDISVDGAIYVQIHGKWRKSPLTVKQLQEQEQENRKDAQNTSCHYVRDEAVNGEAASVYKAHAETEGLKSDGLVWISKRNGLVLRQEEDLDMSGDKLHVSAHYQYGKVTAPSVTP